MNTPRISIIAALGDKRELGKKNDLIWRIKADLKRVKELTMGHPIIMGQFTYESIGKPLSGRTNIVLTKDKGFRPEGCVMAYSLEDAFQKATEVEEEEIFIFGGASVYHATIDMADRLYLTLIHDTDDEADAFFPEYESKFSPIENHPVPEQEGVEYEWITLERN